ncbi:MAG TPA: hypothetical protein VL443_23965 [Cyclobacteriaceae bacterium]|jgi:hypothetical protein|nr:hypothetical protein [Cyclobacteriaceae bacterium]
MTQQEFEDSLDKYIFAHIGVSIEAPGTTPMDKQECKVMLKQMFSNFVIPMQRDLTSLESKQKDLELELSKAKELLTLSLAFLPDRATILNDQIEDFLNKKS